MKATYEEFIRANPNCSGYQDNPDAKKIFEFLNQDDIIIKMIESADQGRPALAGCVFELENFYKDLNSTMISFDDGFTRTVIGRMIKVIIEPFGYQVTKQKDFTKNKRGEFFTSASCYALTGSATMHIVKRVEPINMMTKDNK